MLTQQARGEGDQETQRGLQSSCHKYAQRAGPVTYRLVVKRGSGCACISALYRDAHLDKQQGDGVRDFVVLGVGTDASQLTPAFWPGAAPRAYTRPPAGKRLAVGR